MTDSFDITLAGSNESEHIVGENNSNDLLLGRGGTDLIDGGSGNDVLLGGEGRDWLRAGAGDDIIDAGTAASNQLEVVYGGEGTDTLAFNLETNAVKNIIVNMGEVDSKGNVGTTYVRAYARDDGREFNISASSIENIYATDGNDEINGNDLNNFIHGHTGSDKLKGEGGDDVLFGGRGFDTIYGGKGDDVLIGGDGNDLLYGGAGDDVIDVGMGQSDLAEGGEGNDTLAIGLDTSNTYGVSPMYHPAENLSTDINLATESYTVTDQRGAEGSAIIRDIENVIGSKGHDRITGDDGNNTLFGKGGTDVINGGEGDDVLAPGTGAESVTLDDGAVQVQTVNGGEGKDTIVYSSFDKVNIDLSSNTVTASSSEVKDVTHHISSIENVIGSTGDDTITGDDGNNVLSGGAGSDHIDGGAGSDILSLGGGQGEAFESASVDLATGNVTNFLEDSKIEYDTVTNFENVLGSSGNDAIRGDEKDNILMGEEGNDNLHGGEGADILIGGNGGDVLKGGAGNDILSGGEGGNQLYGGEGNDVLFVGEESSLDYARGGSGDDVIVLSNTDQAEEWATRYEGVTLMGDIKGGEGTDLLSFDTSFSNGVVVDMAEGSVSNGDDQIAQVSEIEQVIGTAQDDTLQGDNESNLLHGGKGKNVLDGRGGDDILIDHGMGGVINGGDGNDSIVLSGHAESIDGGDGIDTLILDEGPTNWGGTYISLGQYDQFLMDQVGKTKVTNIENVSGTSKRDVILGDDNNNILNGGGSDGEGQGDGLLGYGGDDQLFLGKGHGIAGGMDGNDVLFSSGIIGHGNLHYLGGGSGDDTIVITSEGYAEVDGGSGTDTAIISGRITDYDLTGSEGELKLLENTGVREIDLSNIEQLQFTETGFGDLVWSQFGTKHYAFANLSAATFGMESDEMLVLYNVPEGVSIEDPSGAVRGAQASNGTYSYSIPSNGLKTVVFKSNGVADLGGVGFASSTTIEGLSIDDMDAREALIAEVVVTTTKPSQSGEASADLEAPTIDGPDVNIDLPVDTSDEQLITAEVYGEEVTGGVGEKVNAHLVMGTDSNKVELTAEAIVAADGDVDITPTNVNINGVASAEASAGYVTVSNIGGFATVTNEVSASASVAAEGSFTFNKDGLEANAGVSAGTEVVMTSSLDTEYVDVVLTNTTGASAEASASVRMTKEGIGYHAGASAYVGTKSTTTLSTENEVISTESSFSTEVAAGASAEVDADVHFTEDHVGGSVSSGAVAYAGTTVTSQGGYTDGAGITSGNGSATYYSGAGVGTTAGVTAEYEDGAVTLGVEGSLVVILGIKLQGSVTVDYGKLLSETADLGGDVAEGLEIGADAVADAVVDVANEITNGITNAGGTIVNTGSTVIKEVGDFFDDLL